MYRQATCLVLCACLLLGFAAPARAAELDVRASSYILIDAATGQTLLEENACEHLAPASVTKVMTLLLVMEALASGAIGWDDTVTASAAAAAKGGSQIYLKEGEQLPLRELLKSVVVSSANDAATALAEHVAGSEAAFVERMNQRAQELGLADTHFANCTGLDDEAGADVHYSCARDIAIMSRQLLQHEQIREYTTIWTDTVRDGQFGLSNTNKLVRFYPGTTGLKTGYTAAAGYCLAASAERDGMELIAVVLNSPSSSDRFQGARTLLDWGFAGYCLASPLPEEPLGSVPVRLGTQAEIVPQPSQSEPLLIKKEQKSSLTRSVTLDPSVTAPVQAGQRLGTLLVQSGGETLAEIPLVAPQAVARLSFWQLARTVLRSACLGGADG